MSPEADKGNHLPCCWEGWEDGESPGAAEGAVCAPRRSPVASCLEIMGSCEERVRCKYGGSCPAWCCGRRVRPRLTPGCRADVAAQPRPCGGGAAGELCSSLPWQRVEGCCGHQFAPGHHFCLGHIRACSSLCLRKHPRKPGIASRELRRRCPARSTGGSALRSHPGRPAATACPDLGHPAIAHPLP